jgi:oligosaccharide repeat unit polymerase
MELLFITSLGVLLITLYIRRDWCHPIVLFFGVWTFVLFLYLLQAFRILAPTEEIIDVLAVMLVGFLLGALCYPLVCSAKKRKIMHSRSGQKNQSRTLTSGLHCVSSNKQIREALFFVLCAISIVVMLVDQMQIIQNILGGASFSDIMRDAGGKATVEIKGTVQVVLYMFIVHPMTACVSPICAIEVLTREKGRIEYFIVNLLIVLLAVFHHGGRNAIIVMVISYLVAYAILRKDCINISRKTKIIFCIGCALAVIAVFSLSSSRGIQDIWLSFYAYFVADIPLGQQYLAASHILVDPTMGFFSLQGLFYPLYSVLQYFGIQPSELYDMSTIMSNYIEANYLSIGDYSVTGSNAFLPAGAYPYVDGGYIFEFVFMFLYGYVSNYLYQNQRGATGKKKALYVFWAYGLILSFCRLYFTSYSYFLGLLWILFALYGVRNDSFSVPASEGIRRRRKS